MRPFGSPRKTGSTCSTEVASKLLLGDYVAALADFDRALGLASDETDVIAIQVELRKVAGRLPRRHAPQRQAGVGSRRGGTGSVEVSSCVVCRGLGRGPRRVGNFAEAVEWQTKAVELAQKGPDREERKSQLELYRAGKPYRLPVPAQTKAAEATAADANGNERR